MNTSTRSLESSPCPVLYILSLERTTTRLVRPIINDRRRLLLLKHTKYFHSIPTFSIYYLYKLKKVPTLLLYKSKSEKNENITSMVQ